jgi:hypothetical protein
MTQSTPWLIAKEKLKQKTILVPNYTQYFDQYSNSKVQWECGSNFLFKILSFLANSLVTDGIFWIEILPNHPVSVFLKNSFPCYVKWVSRQQEKLQSILDEWKEEALKNCEKAQQDVRNQNKFNVCSLFLNFYVCMLFNIERLENLMWKAQPSLYRCLTICS